jgi:hypothetical protein
MSKSYDPLDIHGQQQAKAQAEAREQLARANEASDIKQLMTHAWGRRLVWRMLEKSGMYRTSFTGNSETFFREGMRNYGIWLTALINEHCPEQYALMVAEAKEATKEHE